MRLFCVCLMVTAALGLAMPMNNPQSFTLRANGQDMPMVSRSRSGDTLFFDDFDTGAAGWTLVDFTTQDTFWHIDTVTPFGGMGHSFWCGTYAEEGWMQPDYGYGDEWVQFLISPPIDLTAVSGDSVLLSFQNILSIEWASGGYPGTQWDGWDCVTVWISTDDGVNWKPISPDTLRYSGWNYNIQASWAWFWDIMAGEYDSIPGWGFGPMYDWYQIGFDLTSYKDSTVRIRWSGVSDPAESDQTGTDYNGMWFVDNVMVYDNLSNVYFFDDCEAGMGDWIAKPRDPIGTIWHVSNYSSHSGLLSFYSGDSFTHYLPQTGSYCALVSPDIDLTKISMSDSCTVDFYVNFEFNDIYEDQGQGYLIEVSTDEGNTWTNIYFPYAGNYYFTGSTEEGWYSHNELWSPYGLPPMQLNYWCGNHVKIRVQSFNRQLDSAGYGLYVDDFLVMGSYIQFPKPQQVLIFDDDLNAQDIYGYPWNLYCESAVVNNGYQYTTINEIDQGIPDSAYMRQNGMVIWHLGPNGKQYDPSDPISQNAVNQIQGYLRMGGKFLLVGQDYLYDNFPNNFADSVLLIESYTEAVGCDTIIGIGGDPIGNGLSYPLDFGHLDGNGYGYDFIDDFLTTATPVFNTNRTGQPIMLRNDDNGRLVFSAFPIEAVLLAPMRDTLMGRIINWLDPYQPAPYLTHLDNLFTGVRVTWLRNPPFDLNSYLVYRARNENGPCTMLDTLAPSETTYVDTSALEDSTYYYGATALDNSMQESGMSNILRITYTGIDELSNGNMPDKITLEVNPNPFRKELLIKFQIPSVTSPGNSRSPISLKIYDITGRVVKSFDPHNSSLIIHNSVIWNGSDDLGRLVPAGIYFVELKCDDKRLTEKIILVH